MRNELTGDRSETIDRTADPAGHLAEPVRLIDVARVAQELQHDPRWGREGQSGQTVVKSDSLRVVVIELHDGKRLGEQQTASHVVIQVLGGKAIAHADGQAYDLVPGRLLALGPSIPYDVEAREPTTLLLTLSREDAEEKGRVTH